MIFPMDFPWLFQRDHGEMVQPAAEFAGNLDVEVFGSSFKSCSTLASAEPKMDGLYHLGKANEHIYIYLEYPMKMYDLGILGVSPFFGNLHLAWNMVHWSIISQPNIWFHQRNANFNKQERGLKHKTWNFASPQRAWDSPAELETHADIGYDARPTEMGMIPDHGENIPNCQGVQPAWLPCHGDWYTYNIYIYTILHMHIYIYTNHMC